MKPYLQDADLTLYQGDALSVLRELPEGSVHMCVTSPPFFGLRDYGVEGQIGLEATPDEWVAKLVEVFREVRRVLRPDGTLWVELGDSYATGTSAERKPTSTASHGRWENADSPKRIDAPGLKAKDLIGTPWLLAFALRADGWWLRQANIWWHTNCLPESAKDRPTSAHSYVFLFSPSARYFYDQVAVQEPAAWERWGAQTTPKPQPGKANWIKPKGKNELPRSSPQQDRRVAGFNERWDAAERNGTAPTMRNLRSVWPIPTQGFSEAHFATFPEALVRIPILAGTSEHGCCPECLAPWVREVEVGYEKSPVHGVGSVVGRHDASGQNNYDGAGMPRLNKVTSTTGWYPSCECIGIDDMAAAPYPPGLVQPCTVLDPFFGSGTTGLVARKHGRRSIGIELSPDYCALAARRLSQLSLLSEATS